MKKQSAFKTKDEERQFNKRLFRMFYDHGFRGMPFNPMWGTEDEAVVKGHKLGAKHRRAFLRALRELKSSKP